MSANRNISSIAACVLRAHGQSGPEQGGLDTNLLCNGDATLLCTT